MDGKKVRRDGLPHHTAFVGAWVFWHIPEKDRQSGERRCWYCESTDSPEHTLFECIRWQEEKLETEESIGERLTIYNMIDIMMQAQEKWISVAKLCRSIMTSKELYERERRE